MNLTLEHIYTALRDSVRFYPRAELSCNWPQTWRVFQRSLGNEISTANLGATICDKGKPYFYSRKWHEQQYGIITWQYPLMYCFERAGQMVDPLGTNPKMIYTLEIGALDVLSDTEEARKCVGCHARTINEIFTDTQLILQCCIEYLKACRFYSDNDGNAAGFHNSNFVTQALFTGHINGWTPMGGATLEQSQKYNSEATFFRVERTGNIFGTAITLRVVASACNTPEFSFQETDFGVLAADAGCLNC